MGATIRIRPVTMSTSATPGASVAPPGLSKYAALRMELEGFTSRPRHGVVFEVNECILNCHGAIVDTQQFSNHLLRLSSEIPVTRLEELLGKIESAGVSLSQASKEEALSETEMMAGRDPVRRLDGTLVIRFVSDEPDLRIPTPAVPG